MLFNKRLLQTHLNNFGYPQGFDFERAEKIIGNWQKAIKERKKNKLKTSIFFISDTVVGWIKWLSRNCFVTKVKQFKSFSKNQFTWWWFLWKITNFQQVIAENANWMIIIDPLPSFFYGFVQIAGGIMHFTI